MEGQAPLTSRPWSQLSDAYDKISTPEKRKKHDDEVREREAAAQRARDAAAPPQPVQPKPKPNKSNISSVVGEARFVKRDSIKWMKRFQKPKEADAQKESELAAQRQRDLAARRERDLAAWREQELAAQRKRDLAAQRQRETAQKAKEQRDREAALSDRSRQNASAQTKATNDGTTSGERSEPGGKPKREPRGEPRNDPNPRDKPGQAGCDGDESGAAPAQEQRANAKPASPRVAILRLGPQTSITAVVKSLASHAVGALAEVQITPLGVAKLEFFTTDATRKLNRLVDGNKFIVNRQKVKEIILQTSGHPLPQNPSVTRVLMITDMVGMMPVLDSKNVKFILSQNGHVCQWCEVEHLSEIRTLVHFGSWRDAEKASQILQSNFPGIRVRYAIDPATGKKERRPNFLNWLFTGEGGPDSTVNRAVRLFTLMFFIWFWSRTALGYQNVDLRDESQTR